MSKNGIVGVALAVLVAVGTLTAARAADEQPAGRDRRTAEQRQEAKAKQDKLTPEEREARAKQQRAQIEKRTAALEKKKAEGTLTEQEKKRLERLESLKKDGNPPPRAKARGKKTDRKPDSDRAK